MCIYEEELLKGSPAVSGTMPFKDVKAGSGAYKPVLWAVKNNVVKSGTKYSPSSACLRQFMVDCLYSYNKYAQ